MLITYSWRLPSFNTRVSSMGEKKVRQVCKETLGVEHNGAHPADSVL